jgi:glycogen debranching enzyme
MAEQLIILDGWTFFCTEQNGDVEANRHDGYFFADVRHLSRWTLRVDGEPLEPLTARAVDYFSAIVVAATGGDDDPPLAVRRERFISDGVHEDVVVENLTDETRRVRLELAFGADFADVVEAQERGSNGEGRTSVRVTSRSARLDYELDGYRRSTILTFSRACRLTRDRAVFDLRLRPHETWRTCVDVTPVVDGRRRPPLTRCHSFGKPPPKMPLSVDEWLARAPKLETRSDALVHTYRQSLLDLAALRLRPDETRVHRPMPGGGIPWFMAVFGRDSLITSYCALPFEPDLTRSTLEALAALQATEWDNFRDAEPGKILHELRRGTLASTGRIPHSPYFGSHDATLLFLIVLEEYERWTGDAALVRELEPNARAAVAWMQGPADLDGDGWLEYRKRSDGKGALDNHCWKDSDESIVFPDGRRAEPPIATCEIQGYAYDARLRTARLAREVWEDEELARRLETEAADLRRRFDRTFWVRDKRWFALALDGEKNQVDTLASNLGHLLWSGIVEDRRARRLARLLLGDDLFSGWGVRTLACGQPAYNPLQYHNGTVWPHDTAIAAAGLRRYGFDDEAARLCEGLLDAAHHFDHQLPELFGGFARSETTVPVEYPEALRPQAWAAAAPLLALRTLLGLEVVGGRLRSRPHVPPSLGRIRLRGLEVHGSRRDAG